MFDVELGHREVLWIARGQPRIDPCRGCRYEAVRLAERDTPSSVISAPAPSQLALDPAERRQAQAAEEPHYESLLVLVCAAQHLLHIDSAYPRRLSGVAQAQHAPGGGKTAQCVDQDGRVEQQRQVSADATGVAVSLRLYPARGVAVPLVLASRESAEPGFDVLPAALVLERVADGLGDVRTAMPPPHASIKPLHELVIEAYVQTHDHRLAHRIGSPIWHGRVSFALQ